MKKQKKDPGIQFFTPDEVAQKSGKSIQWVRKCIRSDKLSATKIGGHYFVSPENYTKWIENTRPAGRPKNSERG